MSTTPASLRLADLNTRLSSLIDEYHQLAADLDKPGQSECVLVIAERLSDTHFTARRAVRAFEL